MNEQELFISALDLAPDERAAYLQRVTGGDTTLCEAVQTLLTLHENARDFMAVPAFEQLSGDRGEFPNFSYLTPSTEPNSLGRLGHYEIREVLGRGATGTVLLAQDTKLLRQVAIKVLDATGPAREHFVREARAAAAIRHDNVVTIHAVEDQGPIPYFVMELIHGDTLAAVLRKSGVLPIREVLRISVQLARGLAAAHQQGLIHRDIKPANILLEDKTARVKITDFGLASSSSETASQAAGFLAGTPNYMSPEQVAGKSLDPRTDLFSLGCVLYEVCTGKRPFDAPHVVTVLERVATAAPQPAAALTPSLPAPLTTLIDQLLAKDPAERPESAQIVADTLQQLLDEIVMASNTQSPQEAVRRMGSSSVQRPTTHRRQFAIFTLLLLIGLALAEGSGISQLHTLVIRFFSPTGTLVIEIADPAIEVTIDDTDIVIRGAGTEELRLKPGQYALRVAEDGKPVRESLVTVARDGREVVRISKEAGPKSEKQLAPMPLKQSLAGHEAPVISVAYSPDGRLLASGDEAGEVRVWDLPSGDLRYKVTVPNGVVHPLTFSPDSQYLVASSSQRSGTIYVWRASSGESDSQLTHHHQGIYELSFSTDGGTLISAGWDAEIAVWDFENRQLLKTLPSPTGQWIRSAVVSARKQIGVGSVMHVTLMSLDGSRVADWEGASGPLNFSSDGRLIAATVWREGLVKVWDTESKQQVASWDAHTAEINSIAFAQHPQVLATVGSDRAVRVWNIARQELLAEAQHNGGADWLAFSPDGKMLATVGRGDRLIRLWDVTFLDSIAKSP